jgi:hypothetical protein
MKILAWLVAGIIVVLNVKFLFDFFGLAALLRGGGTGGA